MQWIWSSTRALLRREMPPVGRNDSARDWQETTSVVTAKALTTDPNIAYRSPIESRSRAVYLMLADVWLSTK